MHIVGIFASIIDLVSFHTSRSRFKTRQTCRRQIVGRGVEPDTECLLIMPFRGRRRARGEQTHNPGSDTCAFPFPFFIFVVQVLQRYPDTTGEVLNVPVTPHPRGGTGRGTTGHTLGDQLTNVRYFDI